MKPYRPIWPEEFDPLPVVKETVPMTAFEFKRMQSMLAVVLEDNPMNRKTAGKDPLPPFHPIARAALPRLRSLERR